MSASNKMKLVIVFVCIFALAIWLMLPAKESLPDPDAAAQEKHTSSSPESIDQRLTEAYGVLSDMDLGLWQKNAFFVAEHGDPDEATEAIIDLIENRESRIPENSIGLEGKSELAVAMFQEAGFMDRLRVLTPLGLTGTKRAEEFLLNAYENPSSLTANKKLKQLGRVLRASGLNPASDLDLDQLTSSWAMRGLLLLDESRYSPMLEEEFNRVAAETESIYKKERSQKTTDDYRQVGWFGVLLDVMVYRDMIRERGTENPTYMLDYEGFQSTWYGYSSKYWDQATDSRVMTN